VSRRRRTHPGRAHKYLRLKWGKKDTPYVIYKCQHAGCTSYKSAETVIGDECECWKCGKAFQMSKASLLLAKPHCLACTGTNPSRTKSKKPVDIRQIEANLDKLLEL